MNNKQQSRRSRKQLKRKRRRSITIVLIMALLFGGVGLFVVDMFNQAASTVNDSYEDDGRDNGSDLRKEAIQTSKDNFSILLIGVDNGGSRPTENTNGLSDALILATFNKTEHSVKLLSIPRDSYVYLPLRDEYTKINHAHSYDGTKGSILTIENLLDIPIDYYAKVNFDAFIDVVDTLGGIEFDIPYEMSEIDSNDNQHAIHLMPGEQILNGEEALAVARTRRYDNDIERGKRQQEILKAIFDRALSVNAILNFNNLLDAVGKNMKTDMSFEDIKNLSTYLLDSNFKIETLNLKGSDMITDLYYYQLDQEHLNKVIQELKDHLEV
ncbi:LCP family protein [Halolactibacillus sp. JCM 19043]|uniref:LCP family protein n=1 Tax=Halolactibacillus sp. JCM 19043 TaxID=1460638 RepID=UPI000784D38F|nr:LCP family protein [Halolactibacillus sp. JCM 19043]